MRVAAAILALSCVILVYSGVIASAQPPDSCACKFIGEWRHHGLLGIENNEQLYADGRGHCSDNSNCVTGDTWTCNGNELTYYNGMYETVYTLSPDGNQMTARGGSLVATRISGTSCGGKNAARLLPANKLKPTPNPQVVANAPQAAQPSANGGSAPLASASNPRSCSDITGLGGGSSGPSNCSSSGGIPTKIQREINNANASMQAGQTLKETDPSKSGQAAAAAKFRRAAILFQEAGDAAMAAAALAEAKAIESTQGTAYCPPAAPKSYWENLKDEKNKLYCEEAASNCVERGSAYYGSICFPPDSSLRATMRRECQRHPEKCAK